MGSDEEQKLRITRKFSEAGESAGRRTKFYFRSEGDEMCYNLDYHLANAKYDGLLEIDLCEAVPEKVSGIFWCKAVEGTTEEGYCGKKCNEYSPKNGISGMCRHKTHFHVPGKKVTFKI